MPGVIEYNKKDGLAVVTDLDTAIFILWVSRHNKSYGIKLVDVIRKGFGQHSVTFTDPNCIIRTLELEFANGYVGPLVELLDTQRDLKRLMRNVESESAYARNSKRRNNKY